MGGSPGDVGEVPVTYVKQGKGCRMSCDVGEATKGLENMGGQSGELSEELVTQEKRKKGWRMSCDVGEATEGLGNEL